MNEIDNKKTELMLRQVFQNLPEAPENHWFTRKVMNRLPDKEIRQYTLVEYLAYLVAIIGIGIGWWHYGNDVLISGVLTGHDILAFITLTVFSIFVPANFVAPIARRWLR